MSASGLLCKAFVESDFLTGGGSYPPVNRHNQGEWEDGSLGVCVEHGVHQHVVEIHRRPL